MEWSHTVEKEKYMASNNDSYLPISEKDLKAFAPIGNKVISSVAFKSTRPPVANNATGGFRESTSLPAQESRQSLMLIAKTISGGDVLLSDASNHVLTVVRDSVTIAYHLVKQYAGASGLETLGQLNSQGRLSTAQHPEFQSKNATASAIATFVFASYVVWKLSSYENEKVSVVVMPEPEAPEVSLLNHISAIDCVVHGLCTHVVKSGLVQTDIQLVKATILFCEAVVKEIKIKERSLAYTEFFTELSYRLVDTEFRIKGFQDQSSSMQVTNEFNRLQFSEIVGNRTAKHEAKRLAQRLACYDSREKKNPFMRIGGIPLVRMGKGYPGTGKSMQISATATLIEEYCERIKMPFAFHPMPSTIVSTFQGGSSERMVSWMRQAHHTNGVNYMPVDDAENCFQNRSREGVSAGVREVISVFLTETEGASAPRFGNTVIEIFTNLPEQIDPAVLSRVVSRFEIEGAVTLHDFLDQDYLWLKSLGDDKSLVRMKDPEGYTYLTDQRDVGSLGELEIVTDIRDERLKTVFEMVEKNHDRTEHAFFAHLFHEVKKVYPMFTSRDVRNIQTAVNVRVTDFDMPDEWFDHPDVGFFAETFDRKVDMLKELRRGCLKGLSFAEIRFQETVRYLNTLASIVNVERERRITGLIETYQIEQEARKRLASLI